MTKARDDLPVEYVRSALDYDPETGFLTWKFRADRAPQWNGKFVGRRAGTINDRGYVVVTINGPDFRGHRLAWAIMTGEWPDGEIDHENLIKSDNRWCNLRLATHAQNNHNKLAQWNNTSGFKGVSYSKTMKSWVARIMIDGRYKVLGYTSTPDAAHHLYATASDLHRNVFSNVGKRD